MKDDRMKCAADLYLLNKNQDISLNEV